MPVLYAKAEPLSPTLHQGLVLRPHTSYAFAAKTPGIPLVASEFVAAALTYPIVFAGQNPASPIIVTGVAPEQNLFVNKAGEWAKHAMVPVYVRRYPFIFMKSADKDQLIYCLDPTSDRLASEGKGEPLFLDGQPAAALREVMNGMNKVQEQFNETTEFATALESNGLLAPVRVDLKGEDGVSQPIEGFRIVDEGRFNALPDDIYLQWRAKGWIALIHAHLLSQGNWQAIAGRLSET
ncbi:putative SapC family protein [Magnetospirillum sp. LM-5]|nr:putative SapC family protein [Magnetospirillum sp. LM-5]